ncbi:D-alanine aminotransferase [Novipirellula artificiosorum]|uniref:D-alanine aminotransferase n=2 Tax=Novipirellula artificiosorum TaxID=2528016 RepID=A0A5C6DR86_9BACT|nr:D-alanine aminotransferase [Novipirellula artificiosorum]
MSPRGSTASHVSFFCGDWIPYAEIRLSPDDLGFRQGVTAVERLRTYGGNVFSFPQHWDRWQRTTEYLKLAGLPGKAETEALVAELFHRNVDWIAAQGDVGITWFATPGIIGACRATLGLHLNQIDHVRVHHRREQGQVLLVTDVVQPPDATWPRSLKVRSRIHYYHADQLARQYDTDASGILVDADGTVTETSIANLAIVEEGMIISPLRGQILGGITQQAMESVAQQQGLVWRKERISKDRFVAAKEILCMGTDTGIWFARQIAGQSTDLRKAGPVYQALVRGFDQRVNAAT